MITAKVVGDVLRLESTEIQLMGLTIFNGKGSILIHYTTKEDADNIIEALQNYKKTLKKERRTENDNNR